MNLWQPTNHSDWKIRYRILPAQEPEHKAVAELLQDQYPQLGDVCSVERLVSKTEDSSRSWAVYTERSKVYVKEILRFRGLDSQARAAKEQRTIDTIVHVTAHLFEYEVKTILILPSQQGFFAYQQGNPVLVSPFVEGHHYQGTRRQLRAFAEELGIIHAAMREYGKELPQSAAVELAFDPDLLQELKRRSLGNQIVQETIVLLEQMLPDIINQLPQYPPGITMGDLHPHDTLYLDDELQAVFDWEKTSFGYPYQEELAFSLHRFVRQAMVWLRASEKREPSYSDVRTMRDEFISAYGDSVHVEQAEVDALPILIAKTNAHKALRVLSYMTGIAKDSMERPIKKLESELLKFHMHLQESRYF